MKYAIYLPNFGGFGRARVMADLARDAESAGWDGFFTWDHIAADFPADMVDPWVALSAAAMQTERIRLGTTVTPLPRRRPWKLARETVSLDRLSTGRLTLGVGIGLGEHEWHHLGEETDPKKRGAMLDEGLAVLTGLWRGEPFNFEGEYYHVKDTLFLPTPVQQPRIPIWVGGFWPNKAPMRRAARWDGVFALAEWREDAGPDYFLSHFKAGTAYTLEQRAQQGIEGPFDVISMGVTPPGVDPAEVIGPYAEAGATWWLELVTPWRLGQDGSGEWPMEALRAIILAGPPREAVSG
jgi:alkanesulfonate monooxygenase SsuD/methylene tetrahydromethanopterin reductase-like flavin-dependent oxidoreductase (luciferase family)